MVTKGTFKAPNNLGYEPRYVLSYKSELNHAEGKNLKIGVTYFDTSTMKIFIG